MPGASTQRVAAIASALALLEVTFVLLFCTEPIAARFWFAVAVTAGIASFVTLLSRRLLFSSVLDLTRRGRVSRLSRETNHDEHGSALLRSILLYECGHA